MTDDCPISFETRAVLLLNPEFVSGTWQFFAGTVECRITFDTIMDQTVEPPVGNWDVEVDGVNRPVTAASWVSDTVYEVEVGPGLVPAIGVTIEYQFGSASFRAIGGELVAPFGPETLVPA